MLVKWRIARFAAGSIERVECTRETADFVFLLRRTYPTGVKEVRHAKRSQYECYYNTWEEAHASLVSETERTLRTAERALANAQSMTAKVAALTKPEEGAGV